MRFKRADAITKIVLFLLILFAVVMMISIRSKTEALREEIASLQGEAAELQVENAELQYYVDHQDDDDVIGSIARKYWNYVYPDEKVYYDSEQ